MSAEAEAKAQSPSIMQTARTSAIMRFFILHTSFLLDFTATRCLACIDNEQIDDRKMVLLAVGPQNRATRRKVLHIPCCISIFQLIWVTFTTEILEGVITQMQILFGQLVAALACAFKLPQQPRRQVLNSKRFTLEKHFLSVLHTQAFLNSKRKVAQISHRFFQCTS